MAESLEADGPEDADRAMDRCGFEKDQFDILVHDYRESEGPSGGTFRVSADTLLKKELVNAKRKLMKNKYFFQTLPSSPQYACLIEQIDLTAKNIDKKLSQKPDSNEEYSVKNVTLPDFNPVDMELLLAELVDAELQAISLLSESERVQHEEVLAILGESDVLFNECRDVINDLKAAART